MRKLQIPQMHRLKYGLPRVDIGLRERSCIHSYSADCFVALDFFE